MFKEFKNKFNEIMATYEPFDLDINLDTINYTEEELMKIEEKNKVIYI